MNRHVRVIEKMDDRIVKKCLHVSLRTRSVRGDLLRDTVIRRLSAGDH